MIYFYWYILSFFYFLRHNVIYTFQALSEEDRKLWLDAMDGKEPVSNILFVSIILCFKWQIIKEIDTMHL